MVPSGSRRDLNELRRKLDEIAERQRRPLVTSHRPEEISRPYVRPTPPPAAEPSAPLREPPPPAPAPSTSDPLPASLLRRVEEAEERARRVEMKLADVSASLKTDASRASIEHLQTRVDSALARLPALPGLTTQVESLRDNGARLEASVKQVQADLRRLEGELSARLASLGARLDQTGARPRVSPAAPLQEVAGARAESERDAVLHALERLRAQLDSGNLSQEEFDGAAGRLLQKLSELETPLSEG